MNFEKFKHMRSASAERDGIMNTLQPWTLSGNTGGSSRSAGLEASLKLSFSPSPLLCISPAHSATLQDQAETAAVTDGLSTLSGLALGAAEATLWDW